MTHAPIEPRHHQQMNELAQFIDSIFNGGATGTDRKVGFFDRTRKMMSQTCSVCGCTETTACMTGGRACHWVSYNLCSACKEA